MAASATAAPRTALLSARRARIAILALLGVSCVSTLAAGAIEQGNAAPA
jgi:hypothetical protein